MERYDDGFAEERQRIERLVEEIIAGEHKIDKLPNSSAGFSGAAQAEYFSKARYHLESDVSNLIGNHKQQLEFIEMGGFSETSYCNERILMQVILDYFMDVMRLKEFHSIERIRTEKLFAYTISWIVRRKPIQFRDYSEEERDIFINERFAAYLLINECLMCGTKHFVQEAYAEKLVEYTEMLLYYFKYRQCDPKTLELLIESFKMGGLVH